MAAAKKVSVPVTPQSIPIPNPTIFDALNIELSGRILVEASAGTGKTYSVALLTLRLIIETDTQLSEILMVTFTNAAVAELEERIRLFIKKANKIVVTKDKSDKAIYDLIFHNKNESDIEKIKIKLQAALKLMDETAVFTIHGFCNNVLTEFAFETGHLYDTEPLKDQSVLLEQCVNNFWRKYISTFNEKLLEKLIDLPSRQQLLEKTTTILSGKKLVLPKLLISGILFSSQTQENILKALEDPDFIRETLKEEILVDYLSFAAICRENSELQFLIPHLDDIEELSSAILNIYSLHADVIHDCFPNFLSIKWLQIRLLENEQLTNCILYSMYTDAYPEIIKECLKIKKEKNQITYDDMIELVHVALGKENSDKLINGLRKKYKAVFLDEFQDTDKLQFEIFDRIFTKPSLLFFIGDPKQSIYAFRRADIFTYFKAAQTADHTYTMDINYRSSESFIKAMNEFFVPRVNFDTFLFNNEPQRIDYQPVSSPTPNLKGQLTLSKKEVMPISILPYDNLTIIEEQVCAKIFQLLTNKNYKIKTKKEERAIKPSDIGILVKTNMQGNSIKDALQKKGIPATHIDESSILQSEEALHLYYFIDAIYQISRPAISKVLISIVTKYKRDEVIELNDEELVNKFKSYQKQWQTTGINSAIRMFIRDFEIISYLMDKGKQGERKLANIFQLIELFHSVQTNKKFSENEFINWLRKTIWGSNETEDEFVQRLESDEEAVKIITIHKSKGLEYNIVFAPYLDFKISSKWVTGTFRNPTDETYYSGSINLFTQAQHSLYEKQLNQEYMRLVYVAVTRAVYKCYIFKSLGSRNTTLNKFLDVIQQEIKKKPKAYHYLEVNNSLDDTEGAYPGSIWNAYDAMKINNFNIQDTNWKKISYSLLSKTGNKSVKENNSIAENAYDDFIFKKLPKGNLTGNLLHTLFETISYNNSENENLDSIIRNCIFQYNTDLIPYAEDFKKLIQEALYSKIECSGSTIELFKITDATKINELEFDLHIKETLIGNLANLSTSDREIKVNDLGQIKGWLNGKIDLFFEYKGKYYILDWKSNFLGDKVEQYEMPQLHTAMNEGNYHLQYLLYTAAIKKYLSTRLPDFEYSKHFGGVIYLFIRGLRSGKTNGVFTCKPTLNDVVTLENCLFN